MLEAEAQDALHALAGEDRGLDRHFIVSTLMNAAAGAGILTLGVFADAENVEGVRLQRALNARQHPMRADIGILDEGLSNG